MRQLLESAPLRKLALFALASAPFVYLAIRALSAATEALAKAQGR